MFVSCWLVQPEIAFFSNSVLGAAGNSDVDNVAKQGPRYGRPGRASPYPPTSDRGTRTMTGKNSQKKFEPKFV